MLTHLMAQRIEHWPIEKLVPWARNLGTAKTMRECARERG
jgi:hypothetical protein